MWWLALLPGVAAIAAHAQSIAGDWQGTLKAGPAELRLVVHIESKEGGLTATLDSPDQGAFAIPISSISLLDSRLNWAVNSLGAAYEGSLNARGDLIHGTFTQGQPFPLDLKRMPPAPPVKPSDIDGVWTGSLDVGVVKLRLAFHFTNTAGGLRASLDSLDQNANGLPVTSVARKGNSLKLAMDSIVATYDARIQPDHNTISGTFTQNGQPLPLTIKRSSQAGLDPKKPQNPVRPFPYREEDVVYENAPAGVKLAATFTIPPGKGPFPAVLLITGSGPQDRDESLMGHKPFLVLSDYLTRRGIAVLRADDRGVGKSTGNFGAATTADFATDAEAGVAWLKTRPEVNRARIGLIGHSEGGSIAPMVAARNRDVAFIVMLAGSGVRGDELLVAQIMALDETAGMSHAAALEAGGVERNILKTVESEKDPAKLQEKLAAFIPRTQLDSQTAALSSSWFRFFLEYDPAIDLHKVTCPVLALIGTKDTQVPAKQNLPAIRQALEAAGNRHFEVVEMPGLNHLFQTAQTGSVSEYAAIQETMSPAVLGRIASWIQGLP